MKLMDLIENGKLKPGTKIIMKKKGVIYNATITSDGKIKLENGGIFNSPSGAARFLNKGKPIDGWISWKLADEKKLNLDSLR
jgi:hypothetical protein